MQIPFKKLNVLIILAGLFLIALGYILMGTEDFIDATEFSLSLHVSPILIILGHVVVIAGVVYRSKEMEADVNSDTVSKT